MNFDFGTRASPHDRRGRQRVYASHATVPQLCRSTQVAEAERAQREADDQLRKLRNATDASLAQAKKKVDDQNKRLDDFSSSKIYIKKNDYLPGWKPKYNLKEGLINYIKYKKTK